MTSKNTKNKLKFKYFLLKDGKYIVGDNLGVSYHFNKNPYATPQLFPIDTNIEMIYKSIIDPPPIEEIYENYLSI